MESKDTRVRERGDAAVSAPVLIVAVLITGAGGLVLAAANLVALPLDVVLMAAALFLLGTLMALVLAFREARTANYSMTKALRRATDEAGRWLFFFLP